MLSHGSGHDPSILPGDETRLGRLNGPLLPGPDAEFRGRHPPSAPIGRSLGVAVIVLKDDETPFPRPSLLQSRGPDYPVVVSAVAEVDTCRT